MTSLSLTTEQISQVSGSVADYIATQRDLALLQASPLSEAQRRSMVRYFRLDVLDSTRLLVLKGKRIENPAFYGALRQMGLTDFPNFSVMAAITFYDVVVAHQPLTDELLFHELIHVEQYRQLGISRFAELYVQGFLACGGYDGIPLEVNAYQLGARFERNVEATFSVEAEVETWILDVRF